MIEMKMNQQHPGCREKEKNIYIRLVCLPI